MAEHRRNIDTITFSCPAYHDENTVFVRSLTKNVRCRTCRTRLCPVDEPVCVGEISFDKIVRSAEVPVFVSLLDNRLEECRRCAPDIHDLSREFTGSIIVVMIHGETCPEVSMRLSRGTVPHFVIFQRGSVIQEHSGAAQKAAMERWVRAIVPKRTEQLHRGFLTHMLQFFSSRSLYRKSERRQSVVHGA